jgi:hypothetical protein
MHTWSTPYGYYRKLNLFSFSEDPSKQEKVQNDDIDPVETQEEEEKQISIDNRSSLGSAIVNRVRKCPYKSCKKFNVKIDQDNWILCNGCMKQYCFLCGRAIHGTGHFGKKCERRTPI